MNVLLDYWPLLFLLLCLGMHLLGHRHGPREDGGQEHRHPG